MAVPAGVVERTKKHEGLILWPYLDAAENPCVTIGCGHMVKDVASFDALPLVGSDLTPVDSAAKKAAWTVIQGMVDEQRKRDKDHKFTAAHYESATTVRLKSDDAATLLGNDLEVSVTALKTAFPSYDSFPDPAMAALIDLMFNIGATKFVKAKWPAMFAAVWAVPPNWKVAAAESSRKSPISDDRNKEIKELFEEAARIQGGS